MEQPHSTTEQRKWKQLTEKDRYRLEAYFNAGLKTQEIAKRMGYSKRTIERERKLGLTPQLKPATKDIKTCGEIQTKLFYLADVAQRRHEERSANKGRNLKIGNDHRLVQHIEKKLKKEKWSPAAILGDLEQQGWPFAAHICVKTLYNYIDRDLFLGISNKDLWQKKKAAKRSNRKVRKVAWNNRIGQSIEERSEQVNQREEFGHWEIDLVVGRQG